MFCKQTPRSTAVSILQYNKKIIEYVNELKYLGVTFSSQNTFTCGLEKLCQQSQRAETVIDLHVLKHKTISVDYILDLFDTLVKSIFTYGCMKFTECGIKALWKNCILFFLKELSMSKYPLIEV